MKRTFFASMAALLSQSAFALPVSTNELVNHFFSSGAFQQTVTSFSDVHNYYTGISIDQLNRSEENICGELSYSRSFSGLKVTVRRDTESEEVLSRTYYFGTAGKLEDLSLCGSIIQE